MWQVGLVLNLVIESACIVEDYVKAEHARQLD